MRCSSSVQGTSLSMRSRNVCRLVLTFLCSYSTLPNERCCMGHPSLRSPMIASAYALRRIIQTIPKPESTDRSLTGRDAGLPESSAAGRRSPGGAGGGPERRAVAQRGSAALRARARGCARRTRACWREPRSRAGAVSGRQAGSGSARSRARAAAHWPAQGQRFGRCRVQRRAEWVSRPARAK